MSVDSTHVGDRPLFSGAYVGRVEDDSLLTGHGNYVADMSLAGMVEVAFVRSPVAHARIGAIDTSDAKTAPGVHAVVTGADLSEVQPFPDLQEHARPVKHFPLSMDRVRYVGTPIAAVVADDRYLAEDAAEMVDVEYDDLPAVVSAVAALVPDAPKLYDDWPDNLIGQASLGDPDVGEILERSRVVKGSYSVSRHFGSPMETRGVLAEYRDDRLTVWSSTQMPHVVRTTLSWMLGLPERKIRVVAPDVGGGFGTKMHVYPEEVVVAHLAMKLRRPVRWIEDRTEHMQTAVHAREHTFHLEAAIDDSGSIAALRGEVVSDIGSGETFPAGLASSFVAWAVLTGPYRVPKAAATITLVATNKAPAGAYRGFGVPEAVFAMERLIEKIAVELEEDPLDLRRRLMITPDDLPYELRTGVRIDSGSHREAFEQAVTMTETAHKEIASKYGSKPNVRLGVGYASVVEPTVPTWLPATGHWTSHDSCTLRVEHDGGVVVSLGTSAMGQGLKTMAATVASALMGVPIGDVSVVVGDTDRCPYGLGSWGSRSAAVVSGAMDKAATEVKRKVLQIAGHALEVAPEDLKIENGMIHPLGSPEPSMSLADVGEIAYALTANLPEGVDPGLECNSTYEPPGIDHSPGEFGRMNGGATYTNATHAAIVAVDTTTGQTTVERYIVVHDCGTMINPVMIDGQIQGGVAQGIGGALYEHMIYDEDGQPLTTSFMDYLVPGATEIPEMLLGHCESPAPDMPFGIKGVGEGGACGPMAAIANGVADALKEYGADPVSTPITIPMVLGFIEEGRR